MPVRKVKGGYRWGNSGKLYPTQAQAARQGRAIYASGYADGGIASIKSERVRKPASSGIYGLWQESVPVEARIFLQTLLGTRGKPITEEDFTSSELAELEKIIQSRINSQIRDEKDFIKNSRMSLAHTPREKKDIEKRIDEAQARIDALKVSPAGSIGYDDYRWGGLQKTLGNFSYTTDPSTGRRVITDKYDFWNDYRAPLVEEYEAMSPIERIRQVALNAASPLGTRGHRQGQLYGIASEVGNAYIGRKGRPVRIAYDPSKAGA